MATLSVKIAIFNWTMFGLLVLTGVLFGHNPGPAHPLILPFLFYHFISPIPGLFGSVKSVLEFIKKKCTILSIVLNLAYFILGIISLIIIIIGGEGV